MDCRYPDAKKTLDGVLAAFTYNAEAARYLGVNQGLITVYNQTGEIRPTLREKLIEKFPHLKRVRHRLEITFESDEQKQAFIRYAKDRERTPYEYCRMLGDWQREVESIENSIICIVCGGDLLFDVEQDELEVDSSPCICSTEDPLTSTGDAV